MSEKYKLVRSPQDMVREFHETFGITTKDTPGFPEEKDCMLRGRLIVEEFDELMTAFEKNDLVGVADGIGDLLYVVYSTAVSFGIDIQEIFEEIHKSNMTKIGGTLREDGKLVKPDTYARPNLLPILEKQSVKS